MGLNIQGMCPSLRSKSFWKIQRLNEEVEKLKKKNVTIPFITIAETWLKPYIDDAQSEIENYNVFRADRKSSKNGGCLIYVKNEIIIEESMSYDDDTCNAVVCSSKRSQCIIASVYRPPNAKDQSFLNMLNFISEFVENCRKTNNYQLLIFGDFNFPNTTWTDSKTSSSASKFCQNSDFNNFMENYFLSQYVHESTRQKIFWICS